MSPQTNTLGPARKLFARAERLVQRAFNDQHGCDTPLAKGFEVGGDDFRRHVHRARMLGALTIYEKAISHDPDGFSWWTYAQHLETISDFAAAATAYQSSADAGYAVSLAAEGKRRCLAKIVGTYNASNAAAAAMDQMMGGLKHNGAPLVARLLTKWLARDLTKSMASAATTVAPYVQRDHRAGSEDLPLGSPAEIAAFAAEDKAVQFAESFVELLVASEFDRAYSRMHRDAQSSCSRQQLQAQYLQLEERIEGKPQFVGAIGGTLMEWPDKQPDDIASVYVSLEANGSEAVTLVVRRFNGKLFVRHIEWGRP